MGCGVRSAERWCAPLGARGKAAGLCYGAGPCCLKPGVLAAVMGGCCACELAPVCLIDVGEQACGLPVTGGAARRWGRSAACVGRDWAGCLGKEFACVPCLLLPSEAHATLHRATL